MLSPAPTCDALASTHWGQAPVPDPMRLLEAVDQDPPHKMRGLECEAWTAHRRMAGLHGKGWIRDGHA